LQNIYKNKELIAFKHPSGCFFIAQKEDMHLKRYWEVKAKANKTGELLLYGDIASAQMWGDEITPTQIDDELKALGELDVLNVYISSGGGSCFAGMAIFNIIKRAKASIKNAYVDGLAASIASVIMMACDRVYIPSNGIVMVHNPSGVAMGDSTEFRKMADVLDKVRETILNVYSEKTGMTNEELIPLLDAETWMTAADAIEMGFADEMQAEVKIAASVDGGFLLLGNQKFDTSTFKNFKPDTIETYREPAKVEPVAIAEPEPEPEPSPDLQAQENEFRRIKRKLLGGSQE
jgi:ATP-dependent Clp protease protease subunit